MQAPDKTVFKQRAFELEAEVEADKARFAAEVARTQAKLDRMNRWRVPVRAFGVNASEVESTWLARCIVHRAFHRQSHLGGIATT